MAHEITKSDSFGYVGKPAWHGLGQELPEGLTATQAFEKVGLNWQTELWPLQAQSPDMLTVLVDGKQEVVPVRGHFAHIRTDNKAVLGVVSEDYVPMANAELSEFADILRNEAGEDLNIETCGSLYGGRKVYVLVERPSKAITPVAGDVIRSYLNLCNGHDGMQRLLCYETNVRVVCANTLIRSIHGPGFEDGVKFRHTGSRDWKTRIPAVKALLGFADLAHAEFERKVKLMAEFETDPATQAEYMYRLFDKIHGVVTPGMDIKSADRLLKRRNETVDLWLGNLYDTRQAGCKGTAWGLLNAATQWSDHQRPRFEKLDQRSDQVINQKLFGVGVQFKRTAMDLAVQMAGARV